MPILSLLFGIAALAYAWLLFADLWQYWSNPLFTTDDARQQLYPLYEAIYPGAFAGDIITTSMKGYLSPLHYWLSYGITLLTKDPIQTGNWVMLLQLLPALVFLFLAVRRLASTPAACFAVFWFLHTRNLVQRMTSGLPRGWAALIIAAYLYFLASGRHRAVIAVIFIGTVLNPPATFLVAASYGLFLLWKLARKDSRVGSLRPFIEFCIACPLVLLVAVQSLDRPAEVGKMVSLEQAEKMPAFSRHSGRFAFLPFKPALREIETIGMQAWVNKWYDAQPLIRDWILPIVGGVCAFLLLAQWRSKKVLFPAELATFFVAISLVYFASRALAFHLYVPDRHLQNPLNLFWIMAIPVALWRLGHSSQSWRESAFAQARFSGLALGLLACFLFFIGGHGLYGNANFNTRTDNLAELYSWMRTNTEFDATIAGHPSHLDGVQLFGIRKGFITTETAHPFYDKFYEEVERRLRITFRAYYSATASDFLQELGSEDIDYFIYRNSDFLPSQLKRAGYNEPFKRAVRKLAARPVEDYFFSNLSSFLGTPVVPFHDGASTVVNVPALRAALNGAAPALPK